MSLFSMENMEYLFLIISIISIFMKHNVWLVFFIISIVLAYFSETINLQAIIMIFFGLFMVRCYSQMKGIKRYIFSGVIILWAILLALHLVPGFNNLLLLDSVKSGPMSTPYSVHVNFDKAMVIFVFVLMMPQMLETQKHVKTVNLVVAEIGVAVLSLLLMPLLGIYLGAIKPEFSIPNWIGLFILNNLFITCVAEEVFFRGYLQSSFMKYGQYTALIASSILFGFAHFAGGAEFIVFATIAGLAYGLIYLSTGRLYMAIIAHFMFNFYHLIFFTYPLAVK